MKKTLKTLLALMVGTMALAACSDDAIVENIIPQEPEQEVSKLVPMTFTAHQENEGETRTTIDGTSIKWSEGDVISIFDGSDTNCGNQCFTLTTGENTTSGVFQGEAAEGVATYYAVYPYAASGSSEVTEQDCWDAGIGPDNLSTFAFIRGREGDAVLIDHMQSHLYNSSQIELVLAYLKNEPLKSGPQLSGSNIQDVVMPAVQTIATGKNVDASAMLMMAQSTEGTNDLKFKNVASYFKFTAPFNCNSVSIIDNAHAGQMAGTVMLNYNAGEPTATITAHGASEITLTGTIEEGKTYYIATLPQTFTEGITMFFVKSDGTEYVKRTTSSCTLGRNKVSNMGAPVPSGLNPPYVTFSAASSQTLTMKDAMKENKEVEGLEYSVGGGAWTTLGTNTVEFGGSGNDLRLRSRNGYGTATEPVFEFQDFFATISFGNETPVACTGDIRTLVDYMIYETVNTANARFNHLFSDCSQLTSAPALPATTLAPGCYEGMFSGCCNLTTAPDLPATTLNEGCYATMFSGCASLETAPALPATTLTYGCYAYMFTGCSSLTKAPSLPATTLAYVCYESMFANCSSLNYVEAMFTTTPDSYYTWYWLDGVASTGTFVKNPAATWDVWGESGVPSGWTVCEPNVR